MNKRMKQSLHRAKRAADGMIGSLRLRAAEWRALADKLAARFQARALRVLREVAE